VDVQQIDERMRLCRIDNLGGRGFEVSYFAGFLLTMTAASYVATSSSFWFFTVFLNLSIPASGLLWLVLASITSTSTWMVSPMKTGEFVNLTLSIPRKANMSIVPRVPVLSASPVAMLNVRSPCAILCPKTVCFMYSAFVCSSVQSPERALNMTMSVSVTVLAGETFFSPSLKSSKWLFCVLIWGCQLLRG